MYTLKRQLRLRHIIPLPLRPRLRMIVIFPKVIIPLPPTFQSHERALRRHRTIARRRIAPLSPHIRRAFLRRPPTPIIPRQRLRVEAAEEAVEDGAEGREAGADDADGRLGDRPADGAVVGVGVV